MPAYKKYGLLSPKRARAIAANNVINAAAMVISSLATIALIAVGVSVPQLFLLIGGATLVIALLFWRILPSFSANSALIGTANLGGINKELVLSHVNLFWTPIANVDLAVEGAWGHRVTVNSLKGDMWVTQGLLRVRF